MFSSDGIEMTTATPTTATRLTLTDDELLALSVELDSPWATEIPTVRTDDHDSLVTAITRGRRSLLARELTTIDVTEDHATISWSPQLEPIVAAGRRWPYRVRTCLITADGELATFELLTYAYPVERGWLVQSIDAAGSHLFLYASASDVDTFCVGLLELVIDRGVPGMESTALRIAVGTPDSMAIALTAELGSLTVTTATSDGVHHDAASSPREAWDQAVAVITDHASTHAGIT